MHTAYNFLGVVPMIEQVLAGDNSAVFYEYPALEVVHDNMYMTLSPPPDVTSQVAHPVSLSGTIV